MPKIDLGEATTNLRYMAERINKALSLEGENLVSPNTPYSWWKRNQADDMSIPMPKPEFWIGERNPIWRVENIVDWYKAWKGIG